MIKGIESICDTIAVFHDGHIVSFKQMGNDLELDVSIKYLAKRINPNYVKFRLRLNSVQKFSFELGTKKDNEPSIWTDLPMVFSEEPEILYAKVVGDLIQVEVCMTNSKVLSWGYLNLTAEGLEVLDEAGEEWSLEKLEILARAYWEDFAKRSKKYPEGKKAV